MELPFSLHTHDHKRIQGTVRPANAPAGNKATAAIIFVHGLTGHSSEHIFYNGARFFQAKGVDAIRFDLYPGGVNGRLLAECTITTHVGDLNLVLEHFRPKYEKIYLVGHSLGAVTVLSAKVSLADALILWAPAASEILLNKELPIIKLLKGTELYKTCWAVESIVGTQMAQQMFHFPKAAIAAQKLTRPTFIACGEEDVFADSAKVYFDHCPSTPKGLHLIKGAGHNFNEGDTAAELHEASWKFLVEKFSINT